METNESSPPSRTRKTVEDQPSRLWSVLLFLIALALPVSVFARGCFGG